MIKVEPCSNCLAVVFLEDLGGVKVKADPAQLDGKGAIEAITEQRPLYRIRFIGGRPSNVTTAGPEVLRGLSTEPGERPYVVREHRCEAPWTATQRPPAPKVAQDPHRAPAAPQIASQGPSTGSSSARGAVTPVSKPLVPCSTCGKELDDPATRVLIELGATVVDAFHCGPCPL